MEALVLLYDRTFFASSRTSHCSGLHGIGIDGAWHLEQVGVGVHVVDREVPLNIVQMIPSPSSLYFAFRELWSRWTEHCVDGAFSIFALLLLFVKYGAGGGRIGRG